MPYPFCEELEGLQVQAILSLGEMVRVDLRRRLACGVCGIARGRINPVDGIEAGPALDIVEIEETISYHRGHDGLYRRELADEMTTALKACGLGYLDEQGLRGDAGATLLIKAFLDGFNDFRDGRLGDSVGHDDNSLSNDIDYETARPDEQGGKGEADAFSD